jgi:hypothetical protein
MRTQTARATTIAHALRRSAAAVATSRDGAFLVALAATLPLVLMLVAGRAAAQDLRLTLPTSIDETLGAPKLLPGAYAGAPAVYGTSRLLAHGWKATYGIGDADDTALYSTFLRLEEFRHRDELEGRMSRDNWRHFLGIEYEPVRSFSLIGGIAKSTGVNSPKGIALAPTGYERLRLNTGFRLRGDDWGFEGWGVDSSFSFIPTGATRVLGDSGFMPGMGDSGPTWLMSLTVSRRF